MSVITRSNTLWEFCGWRPGRLLTGALCLVIFTACARHTSESEKPGENNQQQDKSEPDAPTPPLDKELTPLQETEMEVGRYGGTLILSTAGDPKTFNPILGNESSSDVAIKPTFGTCWGYDFVRQEEEPALCETYVRSEDGLTYTFKLRAGLKWSDGHPITASDFEFTYRVILDGSVPNSERDIFKQGVDDSGAPLYPRMEIVDERSFRFHLHRQDVQFQNVAGNLAVIPKHKWSDAYQNGRIASVMSVAMDLNELVGSGPFIVREYTPGKSILLKRNPHYWKIDKTGRPLPYLDSVRFLISRDLQAAVDRFESGETHIHDVSSSDYERLKRSENSSNFTVHDLGPSYTSNYLMFNLDPGGTETGGPYVSPHKLLWFQNQLFRAAISHGIDRDAIVRNVLRGRGQPLWCYSSPANRKWHNPNVATYPYDRDKATRLLETAGFQYKDGQLHDSSGHPVEFTIMTNAESDTRIGMLAYIKHDLGQLGIRVKIQPAPFNELISAIRDHRRFEAIVLGWGAAVPPDPSFSRNVLLSSGLSHIWHPSQAEPATEWEAEIDSLMTENTTVPDMAVRKATFDKILRIFSEQQPQIQLVVGFDAAAARDSVGNFRPVTLGPKTHWNLESLYLRPSRGERGQSDK